MISDFNVREKTAKTRFTPNGVYFGIVKRRDPETFKVWVEIPRVFPGADYGPLMVTSTKLPQVGDTVGCLFVENRVDDIVVIGTVVQDAEPSDLPVLLLNGLSSEKPSPPDVEGVIFYETDTNAYKTWNGSAWVLIFDVDAISSAVTAAFDPMRSTVFAAIVTMEVGN